MKVNESLFVCLFVCLFSIEMDMEALIKKPRPVLESAHQDLANRGGLELIGHLFWTFFEKVGFGNWLAAKNRPKENGYQLLNPGLPNLT